MHGCSCVRPLSLALLSFFSGVSFANTESVEDSVHLGTLTITAQRSPTTLQESAQKVLIIDQDAIRNQLLLSDDSSQILAKLIPGYAPASEKFGTVGESFRGREVLFMIDGVPQSNPLRDGSRESRTIDLGMVNHIEVIYGASAEQGMGATGGIINFVTKTAKAYGTTQEINLNAHTGNTLERSGTGGSVRYQLSHSTDNTRTLFALKYGKEGMYHQADGRMVGIYGNQGDLQGGESYDAFIKSEYDLDEEKTLGLTANYYHFNSHATLDYENIAGDRSTGYTDTAREYTGSDWRGKTPYNDVLSLNATYRDENFFGTRLNAQAFYNDFTARYGANYAANYQDPTLAPVGTWLDQSENTSTKTGVKLSLNKDDLLEDTLSITAGVDFLEDETAQKLILSNRSWAPPMLYRSVSPFVQARLRLLDRLNLSAGVRQEMGDLKVDDFSTLAGYTRSIAARRYSETFVSGGRVDFKETLPSVGVVYDVNDRTQLFANYAKGLSVPDIGGTLRAINRTGQSVESINLEPIVTDNSELGIRFNHDKLSADVSIYRSKSDLGSTLEYDALLEGYRASRQKTDITGLEASLRYQATPSTELSASYAHSEGKYDAGGDGIMVDMSARNISPNKLGLGINYHFKDPKKQLSMTATHLFSRDYPHINNTPSTFDGYTLVDFSYQQPFYKGTLGLGVNNLLNESYEVFLTDAVLPTSERYTGGRGRNYNISYRFEF